jgi:hypothetical protein
METVFDELMYALTKEIAKAMPITTNAIKSIG